MESLLYIFDKIILALFISLLASLFFYLFLMFLRPKIKISDKIAKGISVTNQQVIYRIKIINYTRVPIIDIRAQLHIFRSYQSKNGSIWKSNEIVLKRNNPISIQKFRKKDKDAGYAFRFLTYEDIDTLWDDDSVQFLKFRIICKHSVSGFTKYSEQVYRLKRDSIRDGDFAKGNTFEII